jgi:hypothetical protein
MKKIFRPKILTLIWVILSFILFHFLPIAESTRIYLRLIFTYAPAWILFVVCVLDLIGKWIDNRSKKRKAHGGYIRHFRTEEEELALLLEERRAKFIGMAAFMMDIADGNPDGQIDLW